MAIALSVDTPNGVATYHMVGMQVYEETPLAAWCLLLSYADQDARLAGNIPPLMQTRFDLPDWTGPAVDPFNMDGASPDPTGKIAFYDYISTLSPWSAGTAVLDVDPEIAPDDSDDGA